MGSSKNREGRFLLSVSGENVKGFKRCKWFAKDHGKMQPII